MRINSFISGVSEQALKRYQRIKDKLEHIGGVLAAILEEETGDMVWSDANLLPISRLYCSSGHKLATLPGEGRMEYRDSSR